MHANKLLASLMLCVPLVLPAAAMAQADYPNKPIRLIVPNLQQVPYDPVKDFLPVATPSSERRSSSPS